jgi:hypothetical protein
MSSFFNCIIDVSGINPVLERAIARWDELVRPCKRCKEYQITLHVSSEPLEDNVLAYTQLTKLLYLNEFAFGNTFPIEGLIVINAKYMNEYLKGDKLYSVLLHEIGHILGIGTIWDIPKSPLTVYQEDDVEKYYYTGGNALREYRSYFKDTDVVGVPIEDDGGEGTQDSHPERDTNRIIFGKIHPGLHHELMTGWNNTSFSLSRITLGFLEDIGYIVDYSKADPFTPIN